MGCGHYACGLCPHTPLAERYFRGGEAAPKMIGMLRAHGHEFCEAGPRFTYIYMNNQGSTNSTAMLNITATMM